MYFLKTVHLLFLLLGLPSVAMAMDGDIFQGTGKKMYTPGWRKMDKTQKNPQSPDYGKDFISPSFRSLFYEVCHAETLNVEFEGKNVKVEDLINDIGNHKINMPSWPIIGAREIYSYQYPIEHMLRSEPKNVFLFEAFLDAGVPVNGYKDYSILKTLLLALGDQDSTCISKPVLINFIDVLIMRGVDIDLLLPDHNGIEEDKSTCKNCTARQFVVRMNSNNAYCADLKKKFDAVPLKLITAPMPNSIPLSSTDSAANSVISSAPGLSLGTQADAQETWFTKTMFVFENKTVCMAVVGIFATVAFIKIAYKNWFKKCAQPETTTPIVLTVINNTIADINLVTYAADDTVTCCKLAQTTSWTGTVYQGSQVVILQGSVHSALQAPTALRLDQYAKRCPSGNAKLTITINEASALQKWWSGSPYRYTATYK